MKILMLFYIAIALGSVYALASSDDQTKCEVAFSHDVCFQALNR